MLRSRADDDKVLSLCCALAVICSLARAQPADQAVPCAVTLIFPPSAGPFSVTTRAVRSAAEEAAPIPPNGTPLWCYGARLHCDGMADLPYPAVARHSAPTQPSTLARLCSQNRPLRMCRVLNASGCPFERPLPVLPSPQTPLTRAAQISMRLCVIVVAARLADSGAPGWGTVP